MEGLFVGCVLIIMLGRIIDAIRDVAAAIRGEVEDRDDWDA